MSARSELPNAEPINSLPPPDIDALQEKAIQLANILGVLPEEAFRAVFVAERALLIIDREKILEPSTDRVDISEEIRQTLTTREPYIMYTLQTLGCHDIIPEQWHTAFHWQVGNSTLKSWPLPNNDYTAEATARQLQRASQVSARLDRFVGDPGTLGQVQKIVYILLMGYDQYTRLIDDRIVLPKLSRDAKKISTDAFSKELEQWRQVIEVEANRVAALYESKPKPEPAKPKLRLAPDIEALRIPAQRALMEYLDAEEIEPEKLIKLLDTPGAAAEWLFRLFTAYFVSLSGYVAPGKRGSLSSKIGVYGPAIYNKLRTENPPIAIARILKPQKHGPDTYVYYLCKVGLNRAQVMKVIGKYLG